MNIEKIKAIFNEKGKVKFKIYSLDYIIEKVDNVVVIYSELYPNQKSTYDNIDLVFTVFLIYNENIKDNDSRIIDVSYIE